MVLKDISVDCVIFGFNNDKLNVLLWQGEIEPLKQLLNPEKENEQIKEIFEINPAHKSDRLWGLVGLHLQADEDLDGYAKKILQITTGIDNVYLTQVKTFGDTNRVPGLRVLTVAYYALINPDYHDLKLSPLAKAIKWYDIEDLPDVIFDHKEIIQNSLKKLRQEVQYHPVGFHLLPEKFTLTQLQRLYEIILDKKLDTRNFRKKIQNMKLLVDTNEKQTNVAHRAAKLYSFDIDIYNQLKEEGLNFRI
ncbi:MAG: NUDIX hydrolase [Bacteroidetes bacterium]|nr:NUDIX hydrolase [Bacteroidota bacterium]